MVAEQDLGGLMRTTAVPIMLAMLSTPAWAEEQLPITIAPGNVIGEPEVSTRYFDGHKAWMIIWLGGAEGRDLVIGFIEGLKMPDRERRKQMMWLAHDPSSDDEADVREHIKGRAEQIWGREVYWFAVSERAVMMPDHTKPETMKDGKFHRGDARRTCAVFTANPLGPTATLIGAYCRDLGADVEVDEATFRQWLEALDLEVRS
jgi:hypothetical protein